MVKQTNFPSDKSTSSKTCWVRPIKKHFISPNQSCHVLTHTKPLSSYMELHRITNVMQLFEAI